MVHLLVIFALFILSGCATLVNGDTVPITVTAQEPGTQVKANGQTFETPVILQMPRGQGRQHLTFIKDGEDDKTFELKEDASAWIFGNVFFGLLGVIFILVDAANPHGYTLDPDEIAFTFREPDGLVPSGKPQSTAFDGP